MMTMLLTGGEVELKYIPEFATHEIVTTDEGITANLGMCALLTLRGTPFNRIQERTTVERQVAVMLPDLVLLRAKLTTIIEQAIESHVLDVPDDLR